ncbi:MAG: methyltransferase domain-containing protein [Steroidobacteraceae bacterium]
MSWSAKQYVAFEDERTRPVRDLLAALPKIHTRTVIDLGCGPGNSTEVLAALFPDAEVSGIDSSPNMIEAAQRRLPRVHFAVQDIDAWLSKAGNAPHGDNPRSDAVHGVARHDSGFWGVILANAVLQWLPDHAQLLPALIEKLASGGALAVQMPDNLDEPAHRLMREVAAAGPWAAKLAANRARPKLASADWYYELLRPLCAKVDLWRTTYHHPLPGGAGAVVEWFKGSGLLPFLEPLAREEGAAFLERYTAAIAEGYPALTDGSVLLPFPRLFVVAIR